MRTHVSSCVRPRVSYASIVPVSEMTVPVNVTSEPERLTGIDTGSQSLSSAFQIYCLVFLHISFLVFGFWFLVDTVVSHCLIYAISVPKSLSHTSYLIPHTS